jgi:hypothetical protein
VSARIPLSIAALVCLLGAGVPVTAQQPPTSIVGAWTLDKEKSDNPPDPGERGNPEGRGRRGGGGPGGFGGGGFGGRGGGGFGRGGGGGGGAVDPKAMERRRQALRDILDAPERMTITRSESMVIVTAGDGRTTRLATDGSKVKDDSTGIERKTHWDGDRLISEISGSAGKITETYALDAASHELVVTLELQGRNNNRERDSNDQASNSGSILRRRVYSAQQN